RQYDLVIFGATSFVGQILCRYMVNFQGADSTVNWAIAGRSQSKLDTLKKELGTKAENLPVIVADAADEMALKAMCDQARVIISTVGPYALYGEPLVKVCAESGTDYCDLTGEVQWIKRMLDRYESTAQSSGARIVHCCGFDSIPSDLGVFFLQQQAQTQFGADCVNVKMRVKALRGEFSGGTVASIINVTKEVVADPALRKDLANPYLICPADTGAKVRQNNVTLATYDSDFDAWSAPFVMSAINTRVVLRSNALNGQIDGFQYDEAMLTGKGAKGWTMAQGVTLGLGGFVAGAALKPTRWLLEKYVVPAPGEGPSRESQEKGFYDLRFKGTTRDGQSLQVKVTGDRDPGYGSTAKMLAQAGLCLAFDLNGGERQGGFWTPSTLLGEALLSRLEKHAGLTFERV
ncbi:MAG: saccharopine dehydrogenase NADP-binding domain-containing protein, partial [Pseudomonadales bacterium]|nr:saccharopine dehydrogenase NADP-binding domain-containing protein [Pseudomonadales bacterium]